jgi:glycosyltransferase involved in cell wall biosynthesis
MAQPAELIVAGQALEDGTGRNYLGELRSAAHAAGVEARCHFVGHVDPVADLFAAADVTVLPSTIPEAFGRTIVESMACGTPVVASRIGGIPEVLGGEFESWLVPPGDAAALAARLDAARGWRSRDPGLAVRCADHVRARFGLEPMLERIEAVFERVAADWGAGRRAPVASTPVM